MSGHYRDDLGRESGYYWVRLDVLGVPGSTWEIVWHDAERGFTETTNDKKPRIAEWGPRISPPVQP